MNVKFPIEVTEKTMVSYLDYLRKSGYRLDMNVQLDFWTYRVYGCPFYDESTPVAEKIRCGKRWKRFLYVRVPLALTSGEVK
jgi:hypothetical protein